MNLTRRYTFEAAHQLHGLPEGHPCNRLHGHHYEFELTVSAPLDDLGMVIEYGQLDALVAPVLDAYDHRYVNDWLDQPTVENMANDIWERLRLSAVPEEHSGLRFVGLRVWETARSSVSLP